ncbi:hypothetical protein GCM10025864_20390 [Luteimicrobium album]|uniref:Uncharacterized protein n=1 Tax=Luteimicrobium album TaxID=1054550 RepID=A0ABQ6I0L0_9MICO|nr:hypothetical protein GCM10025864_20390 [Luteimicrobium album]
MAHVSVIEVDSTRGPMPRNVEDMTTTETSASAEAPVTIPVRLAIEKAAPASPRP